MVANTDKMLGTTVDRNLIAVLVEAGRLASLTWHDGCRNRTNRTDHNGRETGQDLADAAHGGVVYWRRRHIEASYREDDQTQPFDYQHPPATSFRWEPNQLARTIEIYEFIASQDPQYRQTPAFQFVQALKDALLMHLAKDTEIPVIIPEGR